eukprot:Nk52_evm19s1967 gene=Nk52_evmTU19s1967
MEEEALKKQWRDQDQMGEEEEEEEYVTDDVCDDPGFFFGDMLYDTERNHKYGLALKEELDVFSNESKNGKCRVLDIGTGTGLLTLLAGKNHECSLYACEALQKSADMAKSNFGKNGYRVVNNVDESEKKWVRVIEKHSKDVTAGSEKADLLDRADLCVSELLDSELIGEGAMPSMRHAHARLLNSNPIVIPRGASVKGRLVQFCSDVLLAAYAKVPVVESSGAVLSGEWGCAGNHEAINVHAERIMLDSSNVIGLSEDFDIFVFDWSCGLGMEAHEEMGAIQLDSIKEICRKRIMRVTPTHSGVCHAILVWWDAALSDKQYIDSLGAYCEGCVEGAPCTAECNWRDHWMPNLYAISCKGNAGVKISRGEYIDLVSYHDDYSFWFDVNRTTEFEEGFSWDVRVAEGDRTEHKLFSNLRDNKIIEKKRCTCLYQSQSPRRIAMVLDRSRNMFIDELVRTCASKGSTLSAIVLDKSVPMIASLVRVLGEKLGAIFVASRGDIPLLKNVSDRIQYLQTLCDLSKFSFDGKKREIMICAEPFYEAHEFSESPLSNVFEYISDLNKVLNILRGKSLTIHTLPYKFVLVGALASFRHLWKNHQPIPDVVEDVDISSLNTFKRHANFECPAFPKQSKVTSLENCCQYPLWEYDYKIVSNVLDLNVASPVLGKDDSGEYILEYQNVVSEREASFKIQEKARVDGFMLWMEIEDSNGQRIGGNWRRIPRGVDNKEWESFYNSPHIGFFTQSMDTASTVQMRTFLDMNAHTHTIQLHHTAPTP